MPAVIVHFVADWAGHGDAFQYLAMVDEFESDLIRLRTREGKRRE
jgi:hypothetical protein